MIFYTTLQYNINIICTKVLKYTCKKSKRLKQKFVAHVVSELIVALERLTEVLLRPLAGVGADLLCLKTRSGQTTVGQILVKGSCPRRRAQGRIRALRSCCSQNLFLTSQTNREGVEYKKIQYMLNFRTYYQQQLNFNKK
ncbi:Hypothetical_protein [Hexamita inflata]|uniref:Hypothetical_protein n=1 Tax=Hexamita inflata TaxID=28002 RepID=A0AA86QXN1_9EUKA|nr:Hypothetical protein HINF_LOCUS47065 [Hexamita inflata]